MNLIEKTRDHVESVFSDDASGHDWWHIYRVWNTAKKLAEIEPADRVIVELGALLHDIGDWKFHDGDGSIGPARAKQWLEQISAEPHVVEAVSEIVATLSFKGAGVPTPMRTLEGKIVQDADRLDAIGAIGIARAFAYGGHARRLIFHPQQPPVMHDNFTQYKKNHGHTINHFHEKLLLLKDRMNTAAGKELAEERHRFMEIYLQQFAREWHGE